MAAPEKLAGMPIRQKSIGPSAPKSSQWPVACGRPRNSGKESAIKGKRIHRSAETEPTSRIRIRLDTPFGHAVNLCCMNTFVRFADRISKQAKNRPRYNTEFPNPRPEVDSLGTAKATVRWQPPRNYRIDWNRGCLRQSFVGHKTEWALGMERTRKSFLKRDVPDSTSF